MDAETTLPLADPELRRIAKTRLVRELVPVSPGTSARWHVHDYPGPYRHWNYHPEYEVHFIQRSTGRFIVGDYVGHFTPGQLVMVGSNLPHHWMSDLRPDEVVTDRDVVFQFHPDWISSARDLMPELAALDVLLRRADRGIEFDVRTAAQAHPFLMAIGSSEGIPRLQNIFGLLDVMARADTRRIRYLASPNLPRPGDPDSGQTINFVLNYIGRATEDISLKKLADTLGMSESAFSRYFSKAVGQSFSQTVTKMRMAHACQLLERFDDPIATIATRTGYKNLSNFNRRFKSSLGYTPSEYRRLARKNWAENPGAPYEWLTSGDLDPPTSGETPLDRSTRERLD